MQKKMHVVRLSKAHMSLEMQGHANEALIRCVEMWSFSAVSGAVLHNVTRKSDACSGRIVRNTHSCSRFYRAQFKS